MKTLFCAFALLTSTTLFAQEKATSNPPEFYEEGEKISSSIFNVSINRDTFFEMKIKGSHWVRLIFYSSRWETMASSPWQESQASISTKIPLDAELSGSYITACYEVRNHEKIRNSAEEGCLVIDVKDAPLVEKVETPVKVNETRKPHFIEKYKLIIPDTSVNQN